LGGFSDELADALRRKRARPQQLGGGRGGEPVEQRLLGARLGGPGDDGQQDG
jgi:hypothetical protein